jgi:hypothetical protein
VTRGGQRRSIASASATAGTELARRVRRKASPERLLESARLNPADRVLALAAMCVICRRGSAQAVRDCQRGDCPAHYLRPYQADVPPRGAPHLDLPPHAYEPTVLEHDQGGDQGLEFGMHVVGED